MIIRRRKAIFAAAVVLAGLAAGLGPAATCPGEEPAGQALQLGTQGTLEIMDDGSFGLASGRQLIGPTSHWSVKLGDSILAPGTAAFSGALAAPMRRGTTSFRLLLSSSGVFIELGFSASNGTAVLTATAVNAGSSTVPVAFRCALDFRAAQIGAEGSGAISRETAFAPGRYSQLIGYDGGLQSLTCQLPGEPELVELISDPPLAMGSPWDFPVNPNIGLDDSTGVLVFWPQFILRPRGFHQARILISAGPAEGVELAQNSISVQDIAVDPVSWFENRPRTVNVSVYNDGPETDVDVTVLFLKEGEPFTAKFVPFHLAWNVTQTVRLSWTPYIQGNYSVCALLPVHDDRNPADDARMRPAYVVPDTYRFVMMFSSGETVFANTSYAGARIPIRIYVNNTGDSFDIIRLRIEEVPKGWTATLNSSQANLDVRQRVYINMTVKVPDFAQMGFFVFYVTGTSDGDGEQQTLQLVIDVGLPPATKTDQRTQPYIVPEPGGQNNSPPIKIRPYKIDTGGGNAPLAGQSRSTLVFAGLAIAIAAVVIIVAVFQASKFRTLTFMRMVIRRALYGLLTGDEYRKTIFEAYRKMCAHLADHGYAREDHVTPAEFAKAMRLALPLDTESLRALTRLFEEARYSNHQIGERSRQSAIENLRRVQIELDKLTTFEEHPSAWERMRMAMGWKDA